MSFQSELIKSSDDKVTKIFNLLMTELKSLGKISFEEKKTSIHVKSNRAFIGLHPKKHFLDLNIVTDSPINSQRVKRTEQVSKNRYHNEIRLLNSEDINHELIAWIKDSYKLTLQP